jgi:protein-S-isoprenylcysteine O-methyltransferase Ste14
MDGRRLPDLGPRGEGWFAAQVILFAAIAAAGTLGPVVGGAVRLVGVVLGGLLILSGVVLSLRGVLDLRENLTPFPKPMDGARLVESGAYRLVRHPIYGGLILGACGWGFFTASPLAVVGAWTLAAFFNLKSRREEDWLAEAYEGYPEYKARTRRLIPWIY